MELPGVFHLYAGPTRAAETIGFRFGAKGTHTSRTMMLEELSHVLQATAPDARRADYATAIIENNCLSKPTASTRRLSNQRLGELYGLDPAIPLFRVLRRLWDIQADGRPLLALLATIARDPLLAATCPAIVAMPDNAELQRDTMKSALQAVAGDLLNPTVHWKKYAAMQRVPGRNPDTSRGRTFKKRRRVMPSSTAVTFAFTSHMPPASGRAKFSRAAARRATVIRLRRANSPLMRAAPV